jgi:hypothetical protein
MVRLPDRSSVPTIGVLADGVLVHTIGAGALPLA